jgi:hypothetical protein
MTLISEFLFSTKESTNSGSKYFKPPSQNQMVSHHVLTLQAMRNSKKSKWSLANRKLMPKGGEVENGVGGKVSEGA